MNSPVQTDAEFLRDFKTFAHPEHQERLDQIAARLEVLGNRLPMTPAIIRKQAEAWAAANLDLFVSPMLPLVARHLREAMKVGLEEIATEILASQAPGTSLEGPTNFQDFWTSIPLSPHTPPEVVIYSKFLAMSAWNKAMELCGCSRRVDEALHGTSSDDSDPAPTE